MMGRRAKMLACLAMSVLLAGAGTACMRMGEKDADGQTQDSISADELHSLGEIRVITREEGSGTRDFFSEKTGLTRKDESGRTIDLTLQSAVVKLDAEEIVQAVKADPAAIGYLSMGGLPEDMADIHVISVDGIMADASGIKNKSYPLSRNFYLAYVGELSETEKDFQQYILTEGQGIVEDGYTSVKKQTSFLSSKPSGSIRISGSTSAAPLMEKLAEGYRVKNPNAEIDIEATDSTSGLLAAMQQTSDIGMSSRELKDYEKELLEQCLIARDAVAVIVNDENPVVNMTTEQLQKIYSGEYREWREIQ